MDISTLDAASLLRSLPAGVVVHSPDTRFLYANPKALKILRLSEDQILGKTAMDPYWKFVDTHKRPLPLDAYPVNLALASDTPVSDYVLGVVDSSSDAVTWVMVNACKDSNAQGEVERVIVSFIDISEERNDIPFREIVELANDVIVITEANPDRPVIVYVNKAFSRLTGFSAEEVRGKTPSILQGEGTDAATRERIRAALARGTPIQETILNYHKHGGQYWLDMNIVPLYSPNGELSYFAAVERDVTALKERELTLVDQAEKDSLTGLLNRRGFTQLSTQLVVKALDESSELSLGMLDIDFFKKINDTHGHDVGDAALRHFAGLIQSNFRASDVVGRVGGEEFVVLLTGVDAVNCQRVLDQFREKVSTSALTLDSGASLTMTVSIGMTALKPTDRDVSELLKRSDLALYEAKRSGRNRLISL